MRETRWWSIAVVGTAAVLASVLVLSGPQLWQLNLGLASVAVFVAFWFGLGARVQPGSRGAVAFAVVTVLFAGAITFAEPNLAVVQCIAFPLVWTRLSKTSRSIIASIAIAIACAISLYISSSLLLQSFLVEALSLIFAIALGLWITRITDQSSERQTLIDELRATQHQVAMLSQDAGVTSERERLAREIHDTIAQDLTGLVLLAQRAGRELSTGDTAAASEQLGLLEEGARTALAETRALVASTAQTGLDTGGITAALDRLAQRYERETAISVTVRADVDTALSRDLEVVLLRCAQEGLANVRKHSGSSSAALTLVATASGTSLRIADNGSGFDPAADSTGFGLSGMHERLALVGGTLDIDTGPEGTTLTVTL